MEYFRLSDVDFRANIKNRVFIQFLAGDVNVRLQKDKVTKFITLNMMDKGIVIEAKKFGATQSELDMIKDGKTYNAAIDVQPYDKSTTGYSCLIYNIEPSQMPPEYFADWADDLEGSQKVIENALKEIINTIYGQIAYQIIIEYWEKFAKWTGAKSQHHSRLGDLLNHSAEVLRISDELADFFCYKYGEEFINRPLLLASAMLHDVGKVKELDVNTTSGLTEYSTSAALSTHIMNILSEIDVTAYKMGLGLQEFQVNELNEEEPIKTEEQIRDEAEAILLLKHCLGAHHGKLEYSSPITPSTPEAYIIHKADELSAELYRYNKAFKTLESGKSISTWGGDGIKTIYKERNKL